MSERKKILYPGSRRLYYGHGRGFKLDMFLELLKEELARQHDMLCWGWGYYYNWDIPKSHKEVLDFFGKPDIILADSLYYMGEFLEVDIIKGNIVGDFYEGMSKKHLHKHIACFEYYDVLFVVSNSAKRLAKEYIPHKKCVLWPWSVDTNFFRNYERDRPIDVFFGSAVNLSLYGPDRKDIQKMVSEMGQDGLNTVSTRRNVFGHYVDKLNASKIAISNNSRWGFMPKKVMEIMACGAFLLTDRCEEFDVLGIKDGVHMVIYDDLDDLRDKIHYYLENDEERERIAYDGFYLVARNFNMANAVRKMVEVLSE